MGLKVLNTIKTLIPVSIEKFRNLREFLRYLDSIRDKTEDDIKLLQSYERVFSSIRRQTLAARGEFTINVDGPGDSAAPRTKKPSKGMHIDSVSLRNIEALQQNFVVVERLNDQLEVLRSLRSQLQYSFQQDKQYATSLTAIETDIRNIQAAIKKAYAFVNRVAKTKLPLKFKEMIDYLKEAIVNMLWNRHESSSERLFIDTYDAQGTQVIRFTHYLQLTKLVNDSDYTYDDYWFVVVCEIHNVGDKAEATFSVDTSLVFETPGKIRGHKFSTTNEAMELIEGMLEADSFSEVLVDTPLNIGKSDFDIDRLKSYEFITDVEIIDDRIVVKLNSKVTQANLEKVHKKIHAELRSLLNPKFRVRYKIEKEGSIYIFTFLVVPPAGPAVKDIQLDRQKLNQVRQMWDLTVEETQKLQQALRNVRR